MIFTKTIMKNRREQLQQIIDDIQHQFDSPKMTTKESNSTRGLTMEHFKFMLQEALIEFDERAGL